MDRRFQPLRLTEPTPEEAVVILTALRERLEKHCGMALDDDALRAAVEWSMRYLPDFQLPDKALDLVGLACAAVRFREESGRDAPTTDWGGTPKPQRYCGTQQPRRVTRGAGVDCDG